MVAELWQIFNILRSQRYVMVAEMLHDCLPPGEWRFLIKVRLVVAPPVEVRLVVIILHFYCIFNETVVPLLMVVGSSCVCSLIMVTLDMSLSRAAQSIPLHLVPQPSACVLATILHRKDLGLAESICPLHVHARPLKLCQRPQAAQKDQSMFLPSSGNSSANPSS